MPEPNTGCWLWTGATSRGYGHVRHFGKVWAAHRLAFLLAEGYLPPKPSYHHKSHAKALSLDHLCCNRACVNPDHLQVVTNAENVRRGEAGKHNLDKTHCPYGHPYSGENLYVNRQGKRECRACHRDRQRRRYHERKAA